MDPRLRLEMLEETCQALRLELEIPNIIYVLVHYTYDYYSWADTQAISRVKEDLLDKKNFESDSPLLDEAECAHFMNKKADHYRIHEYNLDEMEWA